jgi:hypothetical protein
MSDMSFSSYERGGLHGHLGIIMTDIEYMVVATYVFPAPINPGAMATIVTATMAAHITAMSRAHMEVTRVYRTYHNMDQEFKKMIINTFDDPFPNALSDEVVGYVNCASLFLPLDVLHYDHSDRTHAGL